MSNIHDGGRERPRIRTDTRSAAVADDDAMMGLYMGFSETSLDLRTFDENR